MVSYGKAATTLLSAVAALHLSDGFRPSSLPRNLLLDKRKYGRRAGPPSSSAYSAAPSHAGDTDGAGRGGGAGGLGSLGGRFNLTATYVDLSDILSTTAGAMDDNDEGDEDGVDTRTSLKRMKVVTSRDCAVSREGQFSYDINLPLQSDGTVAGSLGMSIRQVAQGGRVSDVALDLDSLRYQSFDEKKRGATPRDGKAGGFGTVETLNNGWASDSMWDGDFRGIVVSSVLRGGIAWEAGVRAGDELLATSATMGDKVWPKSTLDGVRSALSSRKVLSSSAKLQLRRSAAYISSPDVVEEFELTLRRPLGINVEDDEDGYVKIVGITDDPNLLQDAVRDNLRIGDRVVAVDASLGTQMWPVGGVEGLASACTSRLPGKTVRLRFERVVEVGRWGVEDSVLDEIDLATTATGSSTTLLSTSPSLSDTVNGFQRMKRETSDASTVQSTGSKTHKVLLSRCRDVIRRYSLGEILKTNAGAPGLAADKVLAALADALAPLDSRTLEMVMNAYLLAGRPTDAVRAFEASTGLAGDGSAAKVDIEIAGAKYENSRIVSDPAALSLYSGTSLLRAHALCGDFPSACRVLAAMESKTGAVIDGITVVAWPRQPKSQKYDGNWVTDSKCYNVVLAAAAKSGSKAAVEMAIDLFYSMPDPSSSEYSLVGPPPKTTVSYNSMISVFASAGRLQDAYTIFYAMKQAGLKPDRYSYTSLIKAFVESGDARGGRDLLTEMETSGVEADVLSYNTVIRGLCKIGEWYEAKELVTDMEWNGIAADSITYGLLMNGLLKAGKPGPCLTLFESACADPRTISVTSNVHIYTTAVTAASTMGDHTRALGLVARMVDAGVTPNLKTFTALMGGCLSSGKPKYALEIFKKMDEPDGYALSMGVRAYCDSGDYDSAAKIITGQKDGHQKMTGKEIMQSYNCIIESAIGRCRYGVARDVMTELLQSGLIPSKVTFMGILIGLGLSPQMEGGRGKVRISKALKIANAKLEMSEAKKRHNFLLFVLDSMDARKLPVPGSFYSTILFEGNRIGGLRKKLSGLLAKARARTQSNVDGKKISTDSVECVFGESVCRGWEDLVVNYDDYKDKLNDMVTLPTVMVRVSPKELRQVLAAERAVTYGSFDSGDAERRPITKTKRRRNSGQLMR